MNRQKIIKLIKNAASVILILALLVIIFYQNRDRDILKFGKTESSRIVTSSQENITSDSYSKSDAGMLGDSVAFLSPSVFSVLDKSAEGEEVTVAFSTPVLHTDGDYAVIYDENSKSASVYKNKRLSYSIVTEEEIIKAKINANGYLLVTTKKEGYNSECVVYNKSGEAIFKWDISKSEFIDGAVSYNNKKIILSVASVEDNKLYGELLVLDITNAKILKKHRYESRIFYDVRIYTGDTAAAFGDGLLVYLNSDGEEKWRYDYSDKNLVKADITEPDMMVLAFLPEGIVVQGSNTDVKVLNRLGIVVAEKTFEGSIDDISINHDTIAFAFGKQVVITNNDLKEKKILENDSGIKKIALYSDGKHVLVIGNSEVKILE